jgi:hypothetical protein
MSSVAESDPGSRSGAFLTPGYGIRNTVSGMDKKQDLGSGMDKKQDPDPG